MIPTKRSVIARLRSRSLEGGWSEDSLCRATRIRVFPRNAVMDRKVFSTKRTISSSWTLAATFAEQYNSLIEFSRVAGTAIFLYWRWAVRASDSVVAPYKGIVMLQSLIFMVSHDQMSACQDFYITNFLWLYFTFKWVTITPLVYSLQWLMSQVP